MTPISRRRAFGLVGGALLGSTGALTASTTSRAAETAAVAWHRLVVVTANVGRDNLGQRERAIRDVRHAVTVNGELQRPLVGWQEICSAKEGTAEAGWIDQYFGSAYDNVYLRPAGTARNADTISVPPGYEVVDQESIKTHDGKGGVSPARFLNLVHLRAKYDHRIRFTFINTHYVSHAWNGREDPYEDWRVRMWKIHREAHKKMLHRWRPKGPIIWVGDVNRRNMPMFFPELEHRPFGPGYDKIAWIPATADSTNATRIRFDWKKTVPMHVDDHDACVAVFHVGY